MWHIHTFYSKVTQGSRTITKLFDFTYNLWYSVVIKRIYKDVKEVNLVRWLAHCKTCGWRSARSFPDTPQGYLAALSKQKSHVDKTREIVKNDEGVVIELREHLVSLERVKGK